MKKLYWRFVKRLARCEKCGKTIEIKIGFDKESKELLEKVVDGFVAVIQDENRSLEELEKVGTLLSQTLIKVGNSGLESIFPSLKDSGNVVS
jgi:hypothetical protein